MKTIVCFGDSVTEGVPQVHEEDTFVSLVERRLDRRAAQIEPVVCVNSGVGGENTAEGLARIDEAVLDHQPNLVIIEFGLNDIRYEPEKTIEPEGFAANLRTMHERITAIGAGVIFTTPNPIINAHHGYSKDTDYYDRWGGCNGAVIEYAGIVRDVAGELGAPVCDVYRTFVDRAIEIEFEGGCDDYSDLTCLSQYINVRDDDGVHPTTMGHELIAAALYRLIVSEDMVAG